MLLFTLCYTKLLTIGGKKTHSDSCKELSFLPSAQNVAKIQASINPRNDMAPEPFPQQDSIRKAGVPCKDSCIL